MKKLSRLLLLFSITFVLVFCCSVFLGVIHIWIDVVRTMPSKPYIYLSGIIPSVEWALPFTLYFTILTSMSYAARKKVNTVAACVSLFIFASGFVYAVSLGFSNSKNIDAPPIDSANESLGNPGLILKGYGVNFVLLDDPSKTDGERVAVFPGKEFVYQKNPVEADGKPIPLPPIPFNIKNAEVFNSLLLDFSLSAKEISGRFSSDIASFAAYTGVVIFLLLSVVAVLEIGAWPLANIFIGAALFRLILSFEVFLKSREIERFLTEFLGKWIPDTFIVPAVLGAAGFLLALYSALVKAANIGRVQKRKITADA